MSENGFSIKIGPPDANGRRSVAATSCGKKVTDKFDPDDAFRRGKFRERCISKFEWNDDAHEAIESKILAAAEAADSESLIILDTVRLFDVQPESVEALWPDRFYVGKLGLIVGDPGKGKSFLTLDIAARISRGAPWPDKPGVKQTAGDVLLLTGEDDLADTVRPRLDAHEADVNRIIAIRGVKGSDVDGEYHRLVNLSTDLERIRQAIQAANNPRAIIIDPISCYLGKTDSHKNAEVRNVLEPLGKMAADLRVAVIAVSHLRKGEGAALYRTMGSLAFIAAARSAWVVCHDEADLSRRLLLPLKSNLGPDVGGLAFSIRSYGTGNTPVVCWEAEPVSVAADDAIGQKRKRGPAPDDREEAAVWLRKALADGARPARDVIDDAADIGFSKRTVERAFRELGGESKRGGFPCRAHWSIASSASSANVARHKQPGVTETTWRNCENPEEEEEDSKFLSNGNAVVPSSESVAPLDDFEAERQRIDREGAADVPF